MKRSWIEVELSDIGDIGGRRPRAGLAFVVGPARQASEPLVPEDLGDGDRAERMPLMGQVAADVIDGEVLFPQGDDEVTEGIGLGCGLGSLGRGQEEGAARVLAELMDQDAETAGGVAEAAGDLGGGGGPRRKRGGPRTGGGWSWRARGRPGRGPLALWVHWLT